MNCKNCQAELPEGVTLCPECGTENASKEKMSTSKKLTMVIIALVVLIAVLVGVIVMGMGGMGSGNTDTPETTGAAEATTPTDGNPDDETCKGTYTAEGDGVMAVRDEVIATMGEHTLTNGQFQIYYWMGVYNFLNYNSSYLNYYGLDPAQKLDTQVCKASETQMTWQQYFVAEALLAWQRYQALTHEAEAAQFQLEEKYAQDLENLATSMEASAKQDGYENVNQMLADQMGAGCSFADYETYMYQYYMGYLYYASLCENITATDSEIEAFFAEHKDEYAQNGLTEDMMFYDVRHALIKPDGGTTENGTTTYSEEEWEACRVKAQSLLDAWLAEGGTEEGFIDLAKAHSADGNADQGGIYEDLTEDTNFVPEFKEWYLDAARVPGSSGLVKTVYGYHLMYFVGSEPAWPAYAEADLLTTRQNELLDNTAAKHPIEVDYSKILIAPVTLASAS